MAKGVGFWDLGFGVSAWRVSGFEGFVFRAYLGN